MSILLIDLLCGLAISIVGVGCGWWLRGHHGGRAAECPDEDEVRRAREVLVRLRELASRVATNVSQHNSQVSRITRELASAETHDTEVVVTALAKLIEANDQMQRKLSAAKVQLRKQTEKIGMYATEARTDALTGLPNRRALAEELARRHAECQCDGKPTSLLLMDVDHFKRVNDLYGHQAGDEVLRGIARELQRALREVDFIARHGGEEFAAILPDSSIVEARQVAERVRDALEHACFQFEGRALRATVSLGVAELLPDEDVSGLIKRADRALYASKEAGRNCTNWHDGQECRGVNATEEDATSETEGAEREGEKQQPRAEEPTAAPKPARKRQPVQAITIAGLLNRMEFCQCISRLIVKWKHGGATLSVALVEVDDFEQLVDRHGPRGGELLLRGVVGALNVASRERTVLGYYAPACLGLLLPGVGLADAAEVAERAREAASQLPLHWDDQRLEFQFNLGVAEVMERDDLVTLLQRAEAVMNAEGENRRTCLEVCSSTTHK